MRKLYSVGLVAVAAAALLVTGGSAANAGQEGSTDTVVVPAWISNSVNFQDDFTGCSHHMTSQTSSTLP